MRGTLRILAVIFALVFVAGCFDDGGRKGGPASQRGRGLTAPGELQIPPDWAELALPHEPGHNHRDVKPHVNLSTPNFEVLGYEPLITDYYGKTAGDYFCGDAREKDGRRLSVVHSWGSDVAFVIADVTDAAKPQKIGELVMSNTQVYDIALTPDFRYVVLSTSPFDSGPDSPDGLPFGKTTFRDACTGEERPVQGPESSLPFASGAVLVDISNPRNPTIVDFRQLPVVGSHSVRANLVKNQTLITVSVDNAVSTASYYAFFRIMETAAGGKLVPVSVYGYVPENQDRAQPSVGLHMDGLLSVHPVTGRTTAWLAYRGVGLVIVDMENPTQPQFLVRWRPFPVGVHSVIPLAETWDGRHYTIIGEECGGPSRGNPSCLILILDTTDPRNPTLVGAWTLPVQVPWTEGLEFSMHYFDLVNRTLFVSTYHGGVWAIDLSTSEAMKKMPSIGVFIPALESPKPVGKPIRSAAGQVLFQVAAGTQLADRPTVLDLVAFKDGTIAVWDAHSGVYMVRFDATRPAPPPEPWAIKGIPLPP